MIFVLDCSFCAALFLANERSAHVRSIFRGIAEDDEVSVPVLWWQEMNAVLAEALRRNLLRHSEVLDINRLLSAYNFSTDVNYGSEYTAIILELVQNYSIGANCAAYLELAMRKKARLGTLSNELSAASRKAGIMIL
ncbi:MAG: type II toxin-antitoxin system VapC family toxin [Treponema sp.]|jgi:predicted nucleic acid-binding protein|nr:type II toxin-antitoxin system VapC family toxin [Treponema sp.]